MPRYPVVAPRPGVPMSPARRPYLRRDLVRECASCHERRELVALDRCASCWDDPTTTTNESGPALMTPSR